LEILFFEDPTSKTSPFSVQARERPGSKLANSIWRLSERLKQQKAKKQKMKKKTRNVQEEL